MEHTISLDKDHSTLVKYASSQDNDYRKVFMKLNEVVKAASRISEYTLGEASRARLQTVSQMMTYSI